MIRRCRRTPSNGATDSADCSTSISRSRDVWRFWHPQVQHVVMTPLRVRVRNDPSVMTPSAARSSPAWPLPRGLIIVLGLGAAVVVVAGLQAFAEVLGPVFLALMLTVAVHPLIDLLRRAGFPSWLAVTVTVVAVVGMLLGLAIALVLSVGQLATLLPQYQSQFSALVDEVTADLARLGVGPDQLQAALTHLDFGAVTRWITSLLVSLAGVLSNLLFILALLLFMGVDAAQFPARLRAVARQRPEVVSAFRSFAGGTRSYLLVSTVFGAIVAVVDGGLLWALAIPLPLLWGLLAFITNYIPNIGFIIGLVPPALLALLGGGPRLMVIVIVAYSIINFVIQSVIQPKYVGDAVDLSLTLTFLSLVFWTWVIGPLGAILAIPLTLLVKALLVDIDPNTRWLTALITSGPAPAEDGDHEVGGPVDAVVVPEPGSSSGRRDGAPGPAAD